MTKGLESARSKAVRAFRIRGDADTLLEEYTKTRPFEVVTDAAGQEPVKVSGSTNPSPGANPLQNRAR